MQNHIKTIFFDLFGVLLGIDQSVVVQYLSKLTNTPYLKTREITMGEPYMQLERGETKFKKYVEDIRVLLPNGDRIDADRLRDIWMNSRVGEMPLVSLLDKLQKKYAVWVISNTTEAHIQSLQSQFVFLNSFNGIITSERAGTHKPHPNIFKFALEEANTGAVSAIFIDDSYCNVEAAENMGFTVHHYVNFETFQQFIQAYIL
jgi:HAD superfamily hydrolase (TIGR01509 family)